MDPVLKAKILTIGMGLFALALLSAFAYSVYLVPKYLRAGRWPKANAKILKSKLIVDDSGDGVSYIPDISYSYSVGGIEYTSDTVYPFGLWKTKRSASYLTNKYRVNEVVKVAFNPDEPNDSLLVVGFSRLHFNALLGAVLVALLGTYFFVAFIHGIREWA